MWGDKSADFKATLCFSKLIWKYLKINWTKYKDMALLEYLYKYIFIFVLMYNDENVAKTETCFCTYTCHLEFRDNQGRWYRKTVKACSQRYVLWHSSFDTWQEICTCEIWTICLPKQNLHNDNLCWHANRSGELQNATALGERLQA